VHMKTPLPPLPPLIRPLSRVAHSLCVAGQGVWVVVEDGREDLKIEQVQPPLVAAPTRIRHTAISGRARALRLNTLIRRVGSRTGGWACRAGGRYTGECS
jgi:hypothetical protein